MGTKIVRLTVAATAAALCVTAAPLLIAPGAHAAAQTTTLTAAQVQSAIRAVAARTDDRVIRDGARLTSRVSEGTGVGWQEVRQDDRFDPVRRAVSSRSALYGEWPTAAVYIDEPCDPGPSRAGNRNYREVVKEKVGSWVELLPRTTRNERAGLKLLHRPRVNWTHEPNRSVRFTKTVRDSGWGAAMRGPRFRGIESGTSTPTATGTRLAFTYRDSSTWEPSRGSAVVDLDKRGTLVNYDARDRALSDGRTVKHLSFHATYGAQKVYVPSKARSIRPDVLQTACAAAVTQQEPERVARYVATYLNRRAVSKHERITVARVRTATKYAVWAPPYVDVRVSNIAHGSKIVGRHKLLKHPAVWTVFVRHGKAVAHRVR